MFNKYRQPPEQEIALGPGNSEKTKIITKLRELGDDWREFERRLQGLEREVWQSHWSHDDPIPERLSRAGMPQEQVDAFKRWHGTVCRILRGEPRPSDQLKEK